jgi:hypothetical protein
VEALDADLVGLAAEGVAAHDHRLGDVVDDRRKKAE